MQFLYSAFPCWSDLKALYTSLLPLADLLHPSPDQLPEKYTICFNVPRVTQVQVPSLSSAGYSFTAEWTKTPFSSPLVHTRLSLMIQLGYAGLEPMILWLRLRSANHSAIATQTLVQAEPFWFCKILKLLNLEYDAEEQGAEFQGHGAAFLNARSPYYSIWGNKCTDWTTNRCESEEWRVLWR